MANDHGSMPAFPMEGHATFGSCVGLTKRELFAAMAMQGMIQTAFAWDGNETELQAECVRLSVKYADALLIALEKTPCA